MLPLRDRLHVEDERSRRAQARTAPAIGSGTRAPSDRQSCQRRARKAEGPEPGPASRAARLGAGRSSSATACLRVPIVGRSSAWLGPASKTRVRNRPARLSPLSGRDAGRLLHNRSPRHPPHPRPSWRLGSPRYPGSLSASRRRPGSRFALIPLAAGPDAPTCEPGLRPPRPQSDAQRFASCSREIAQKLRRPPVMRRPGGGGSLCRAFGITSSRASWRGAAESTEEWAKVLADLDRLTFVDVEKDGKRFRMGLRGC